MKKLCQFRGFEKCFGYEIDAYGNVFSHKTGRFLQQQTDRQGYKYIQLNVENKRKHLFVHRLVWIFHHGHADNNLQINHIDGNKENNSISNLELVTGKENISHSYAHGLRTAGHGSGHLVPVFSIDKDGNETRYESIKIAAASTSCDGSQITKVCKGKLRSCGGFLWKYALDGATK